MVVVSCLPSVASLARLMAARVRATWAGSSSTRRSLTSLRLFTGGLRDCKTKGGALARLALDPHLPAMLSNDLSADRQAHTCTRVILFPVQALENAKDFFVILRIDPDSVVGHRHYQ